MARPLRFVPEGGALVEVTVRTFQSRPLLRPSPALNEIVGGVLGRAQSREPVRCHAAAFLSNHFHLLLSVDHALQLARFMEYLNSNLAREINRLHDWSGDVWERRYRSILVSSEQDAQVSRLKYILAHGVKEGLVARASDWPGVHSLRETLAGKPIRGMWFDRTAEYKEAQRRQGSQRPEHAIEETFILSPLPCWAHLPADTYRQQVATMVAGVEEEAAAYLAGRGLIPLGVNEILRQDPQTRPNWTKKSSAPPYHAATKVMRQLLRAAYQAFVDAFRTAAERWKAGDRTARFPVGSFPPGLSFVHADGPDPPWA
jgi:REP element-mobilizing transposase RayT